MLLEALFELLKSNGGSMRVNDASQVLSRAVGAEAYRQGIAGRASFTRFLRGHKALRVADETVSLMGATNGAGGAPPPMPAAALAGPPGYEQPMMAQPMAAAPPPVPGAGLVTSGVRFSELTNVSPGTQRAIREVLGYEFMTPVQAQTLPVCLGGGDVIAKAKTGTGKTMGFLLPSIERIVAAGSAPGRAIHVLVLSPTRELAKQIATECDKLVRFQHGITTQCVMGGTNMKSEARRMNERPPTVLVATPGRLQDHLDNTPVCGALLRGIHTLVLDECDQLVDMGFWPSIRRILEYLPQPQARQTLLYSATMGPQVIKAAKTAMRPGYQVIDTVGEEASTADTVDQSAMVVPLECINAALVQTVMAARQVPSHKIIAFFTTARQTQWAAELFAAMGAPVYEIHSRKSQSAREKTSAQFRSATNCVLFSSDVSARGMDYPDVTQVIQVGAPTNKEQYTHRLGRAGRAGKSGQCMLLVAEHEQSFLRSLQGLPVKHVQYAHDPQVAAAADQAARRVDPKTGAQAYQAWLGYYNGCNSARMPKPQLVAMANEWARIMGLPGPPRLEKKTVGKMGLKGVPGLNVG